MKCFFGGFVREFLVKDVVRTACVSKRVRRSEETDPSATADGSDNPCARPEAMPRYFDTAIVMPTWLFALPTVIVTGKFAGPVPEGMRAFTCITPATSPGAPPAYRICAPAVPMLTSTL